MKFRIYEFETEDIEDDDLDEELSEKDEIIESIIQESNISSQELKKAYQDAVLQKDVSQEPLHEKNKNTLPLTALLREMFEENQYPINRILPIIEGKEIVENGIVFLGEFLEELNVETQKQENIMNALHKKMHGDVVIQSPLLQNPYAIEINAKKHDFDPNTVAIVLMENLEKLFSQYPDLTYNVNIDFFKK